MRRLAVYVALAAVTIALGLWVHLGGAALGANAQDVLGDALWAAMIAWWIGAIAPSRRLASRSAVALGICVAVELSQLVHAPALDELRRTTMGQLVLGSGFDPRDLLAYSAGVGAAALIEWTAVRYSAAMAPAPRANRPVVAVAILAAIAIPIGLVVVYSEAVSTWLGRFLPPNAQPLPAAFFCLAFLLMAWISSSNLRQARASASWPTAAGRISRSDVVKEMMYPGTARRGTKVPVFTPLVEFEYSIGGHKYSSQHVQFGATVKGAEEAARARLVDYPVGRELPVRYDPAHPENAVLKSTVAYPVRTIVITVVFAVLALYFGGGF